MEMRRRMALAGCVVFASVMLSGRAAWAVDACSLLTTAQAATALGVPDVNAGAGANRCIWTPKKYAQGAGQLTVQIEGANDGAKMTGQGTPVSGIGDEAIQTVVGNAAVLHVRKGNYLVRGECARSSTGPGHASRADRSKSDRRETLRSRRRICRARPLLPQTSSRLPSPPESARHVPKNVRTLSLHQTRNRCTESAPAPRIPAF